MTEQVAVTADAVWPSDDPEIVDGVVVNWFVTEGASVADGDVLCEIQVEKVSVDVTASTSGTVRSIERAENEEFERTDTLAFIEPA